MATHQDRAAMEWFAEATRWYAFEHQACPNCKKRHCVFRSRWASRVEYHCTECDFSAAHDEESDQFSASRGSSRCQMNGPA